MAAKRNTKTSATGRATTTPHVQKSEDERNLYRDHLRSALGSGETAQPDRATSDEISAFPSIDAEPAPVGVGQSRRIPRADQRHPAELSLNKKVAIIGSIVGVLALLVAASIRFGRLSECVDASAQHIAQLDDKLDKAKEQTSDMIQRLARLEAQVEAVAKTGSSTVAIAAEVTALKLGFAERQTEDARIKARIEAIEARLGLPATRPTPSDAP